MRLPVTPQISTKDGVSNKNARMTNMLQEKRSAGDLAVIRPGLSLEAESSGVGGGLVEFNNELVSVYGATLGKSPETQSTDQDITVSDNESHSFMWHNGKLFCVSGTEIFKSTNFGASFSLVGNTPELSMALGALVLLSLNDVLYFFGLTSTYSSDDDGGSWSLVAASPYYSANCVLDGYSYHVSATTDREVEISRTSDFISSSVRGTIEISYDDPADPVAVSNAGTILGTASGILFYVKFLIYEDSNTDEITRMWIYTSADHGATWTEKMNDTSPAYQIAGLSSGGELDGMFCFTNDGGGNGIVGTTDGTTLSVVDATVGNGTRNHVTMDYPQFTAYNNNLAPTFIDDVVLYHRGVTSTGIPSVGTLADGRYDFAQSPL